MKASDGKGLIDLEAESARLKKMLAIQDHYLGPLHVVVQSWLLDGGETDMREDVG